ncbi:uncharacterized protein SEPMUDRAFT_126338 [Sphaerulina musiva SO2202]|uniref:Uncharacterized protein n=1 Tax=Sphaerulina musiva (strain SO2202) TaxID=692275 RepID=N1QFA9_SPHMS|nr:uncharacterized protein SEPMUDRAFT_126338 [Sphaerulina musiva SO2202]EMF11968.1 hypothetical protein SEPMUDRAFT_126338 [Sphaerulina musiva SO2202]
MGIAEDRASFACPEHMGCGLHPELRAKVFCFRIIRTPSSAALQASWAYETKIHYWKTFEHM